MKGLKFMTRQTIINIIGTAFSFVIIGCSLGGCADCEEIRNDADRLKQKHLACDTDDTCVIVDMLTAVGVNNCLGPFQCATSLNEKNIGKFKSEARDLAQEYKDCNSCVQVDCMSADEFEPFCNEETGQCDKRLSD